MRPHQTLAALAMVALPAVLPAQGGRMRDANRGAPEQATFTAAIPTVKAVREGSNVAALLLGKRKALALDDAAADSLKRLADAIDARNAPSLSAYDSLRTKVRAAQNTPEAETLEGRARAAMLGTTVRDLQARRQEDIPAALALVPAEKQEAARKLIADQDEDLQRAMAGRRAGGGRRP